MEQPFIASLLAELHMLSDEERRDIARDFEEYFALGRIEGKSDAEIAEALGNPSDIAAELRPLYKPQLQAKSLIKEQQPYTHLTVEIEKGSLRIETSLDDMPHAHLIGGNEYTQLTMETIGDTLTIRLIDTRPFLKRFFPSRSPIVHVQLPKQLFGRALIKTDNGSTEIVSLRATSLDLRADNGAVDLIHCTAKEMKLRSANGSVRGEHITATTLRAESDNGKVTLQHCHIETLQLRSDNGLVRLTDVRALQLEASSANGKVELTDVHGAISARSDNGAIRCFVPALDAPIELTSANGRIQLVTKTLPTNVAIRAANAHGKATIFDERRNVAIYGSGEVPIQLSSSNGKISVELDR